MPASVIVRPLSVRVTSVLGRESQSKSLLVAELSVVTVAAAAVAVATVVVVAASVDTAEHPVNSTNVVASAAMVESSRRFTIVVLCVSRSGDT